MNLGSSIEGIRILKQKGIAMSDAFLFQLSPVCAMGELLKQVALTMA